MKRVLLTLSFIGMLACIMPITIQAQCNGQDSLNCQFPLPDFTCDYTICVDGTDYDITIEYNRQLPTQGLIRNPCRWPLCIYPLDQVSWIRRICVPPAIQNIAAEKIYNGIIRATNLCTDNCFGATIPDCSLGSVGPCPLGTPQTSIDAYCHIIAFPRCYRWIAGCIEVCNEAACEQYCFAEWRYCNQGGNCTQCFITVCGHHDFVQCPLGCLQANCEFLGIESCVQP
ncbi:MAG: hypothetical protein QY319_05465 [Candidatus Kapaibacterium sp.]|nr:MAG: hypothetical protein HRU79_08145 [Ignavibacteria bacterium]WKZ78854.1 MAG: hypothetical protein QY319_05465 [Candidatus Kapabacteria bacterium]